MQRTGAPASPPGSLSEQLNRWVEARLITARQAAAIREHEGWSSEQTATPAARPSLVVEALGYLGGVVMLVGATILVSTFWHDISTIGRLTLISATAAALIGAGFAVSDRLGPAAGRLRSVLWAAGVIVTGAFFSVLAVDVLNRRDYHPLVLIGPASALIAAPLWWMRRTSIQQLALFGAAMIAIDGITLELTSGDSRAAGAALWGTGVAWTALCRAGWLEPSLTGVIYGALGATLGSLMMDNTLGIALGLLTAASTLALALAAHSLPWLGAAAVALLATAPRAANEWFPGRLSAAVSLILAGGALVVAAIWVARRRPTSPTAR